MTVTMQMRDPKPVPDNVVPLPRPVNKRTEWAISLAVVLLVAALVMAALLQMAQRTAAATPHPQRAVVVWVYLDQADQPTLVAKSMLSHVHACHDGTCKAAMVGYPRWVFVRKQDIR